jgi:3'(2'), 5'-bisphosphate nucleotidase
VCKKWDTCAPEAVLHAVGGRMTDVRGCDYAYNKSTSFPNEYGTLATAVAQQHQSYLDLIPQHVKDQVKDVYKKKKILPFLPRWE